MKKWIKPSILNLGLESTKDVCEPPLGYIPPNNGSDIQPNDEWCCKHNMYHGKNHCKGDHDNIEGTPQPPIS